jgi:3-methylfumaryl-CoA hydratase
MWAGSTIRFIAPLRVNDMVEAQTTIADVVEKTTPRQRLHFVTLRHEYRNDAGPMIEDVQTLVYRVQIDGARTQEPAEKAPVDETILATFRLNDTELFRYSAVTFNSHRIHLDRAFCQAELGTPRLVVHGPLLATIAARAAATVLGRELTAFSFRARRPIFEDEEFIVALVASAPGECAVTIRGTDGSARLEATAKG